MSVGWAGAGSILEEMLLTWERQGEPFHPLSVNKQAGSEHLRVFKIWFIDSFSKCLLSTCSGLEAELGSGDNDDE